MEIARRNAIAYEMLKAILNKGGVNIPNLRAASSPIVKKLAASEEEMMEFAEGLLRDMLHDELAGAKKKRKAGFQKD